MRRSAFKTALVFVLIFSITFSQTVPTLSGTSTNKLRAAFVGIKFENLPPDVQQILFWRITGILETQAAFTLTKPDSVQLTYGRSQTAEFLEKQDAESFAALARALQLDHVFSGILANQSVDNNHLLLVGQLNRYDFRTGQIKIFKINHDYEQLGNALIEFKEQYVDTVPMINDATSSFWSRVFVGGVILTGIVAISLLIGRVGGGEGEEEKPPPGDH